jgi:CRP-like cAMP-binding protein
VLNLYADVYKQQKKMNLLIEHLKNLGPVSSEEENALKNIIQIINIKKNQELQPSGGTCKNIYFVNKGLARIYYFHGGNDITDSFSSENRFLVRVESLITGKPSRKAIQMLEDSEVFCLPAAALNEVNAKHSGLDNVFRKVFQNCYVDLVNRIESIQFHTADERYANLLNDSPDLLKRVPLKYIASYLGITQTSLSRIRHKH